MNALTIFNYIHKLEKENKNLREENEELREAIVYMHSLDPMDDAESVASNDDAESIASDSDSDASDSTVESPRFEEEVNSNEGDEDSDSDATVEAVRFEEEEESEYEDSEEEEEEEEEEDSEEEEEEENYDAGEYVSYINRDLSRLFLRLANKETDQYKKKVYTNAAKIIKELPFEPTEGKRLLHIKGIGYSIAKLIDEYMATGTFKKLHT